LYTQVPAVKFFCVRGLGLVYLSVVQNANAGIGQRAHPAVPG
jgi:hypothetical protein